MLTPKSSRFRAPALESRLAYILALASISWAIFVDWWLAKGFTCAKTEKKHDTRPMPSTIYWCPFFEASESTAAWQLLEKPSRPYVASWSRTGTRGSWEGILENLQMSRHFHRWKLLESSGIPGNFSQSQKPKCVFKSRIPNPIKIPAVGQVFVSAAMAMAILALVAIASADSLASLLATPEIELNSSTRGPKT